MESESGMDGCMASTYRNATQPPQVLQARMVLGVPEMLLFRRSQQVPELEAGGAFPCPPGHSWHHLQSRAHGTWLGSGVDPAPWTEVS